ncbi:hypothetical protein DRH13_02850 [Candidatus Woesebacteria bacterium]|nr:MAG: hypothetical protein DRH13_02850 [Candidatus Woesebacteria bacterium]
MGVGVPIFNHHKNIVTAISVAAISERIDKAGVKKLPKQLQRKPL